MRERQGLEDGIKAKTLKRHLQSAHGMTPRMFKHAVQKSTRRRDPP